MALTLGMMSNGAHVRHDELHTPHCKHRVHEAWLGVFEQEALLQPLLVQVPQDLQETVGGGCTHTAGITEGLPACLHTHACMQLTFRPAASQLLQRPKALRGCRQCPCRTWSTQQAALRPARSWMGGSRYKGHGAQVLDGRHPNNINACN